MSATSPPKIAPLVLLAGIAATSWAAIFFRLADEAPALTIAAYRLLIATVLAICIALVVTRGHLRVPSSRRDRAILVLSGVFLAAHFWTWFLSLNRTSVGSAVVIVAMQPLIAGLLGIIVLKERPSRNELIGIAIATTGLLIIGGRDFFAAPGQLTGDLFALAGAFLAGCYRLAGRSLRSSITTLEYSALCYGVAAIVLWGLVATFRPQVRGFETDTWTFIVLLAVVPQVIGHTAFNWALAHFRVVTLALVTMSEPVAATLLAIPVLDETPNAAVAFGGPLILLGVLAGLRPGRPPGATLDVVEATSPSKAQESD